MTSAGDDWMREIERRQGYDAMAHDEGYGPMTDEGLVHQLRNSRGWPTLGNAAADRIEALEAENARLRRAQGYTYIGMDGKPVLARDLEDECDALKTEVEGALAIIAVERAEVLKLREENARFRGALLVYADPCDASETKPCGYEGNMCCMTARAALKGDNHD